MKNTNIPVKLLRQQKFQAAHLEHLTMYWYLALINILLPLWCILSVLSFFYNSAPFFGRSRVWIDGEMIKSAPAIATYFIFYFWQLCVNLFLRYHLVHFNNIKIYFIVRYLHPLALAILMLFSYSLISYDGGNTGIAVILSLGAIKSFVGGLIPFICELIYFRKRGFLFGLKKNEYQGSLRSGKIDDYGMTQNQQMKLKVVLEETDCPYEEYTPIYQLAGATISLAIHSSGIADRMRVDDITFNEYAKADTILLFQSFAMMFLKNNARSEEQFKALEEEYKNIVRHTCVKLLNLIPSAFDNLTADRLAVYDAVRANGGNMFALCAKLLLLDKENKYMPHNAAAPSINAEELKALEATARSHFGSVREILFNFVKLQ